MWFAGNVEFDECVLKTNYFSIYKTKYQVKKSLTMEPAGYRFILDGANFLIRRTGRPQPRLKRHAPKPWETALTRG